MRFTASLAGTVWILLSLSQLLSSIPRNPEPCVPSLAAILHRGTSLGLAAVRLRGGEGNFYPATGSPVADDSVPKKPTPSKKRVGPRKKAEYFEGGGDASLSYTPATFRGVHLVPPGTGSGEGEEFQAKYQRKIIGNFPSVRAAALAYDFRMLTLREEVGGARAPAYNFADSPRLFQIELEVTAPPRARLAAGACKDDFLFSPANKALRDGIEGSSPSTGETISRSFPEGWPALAPHVADRCAPRTAGGARRPREERGRPGQRRRPCRSFRGAFSLWRRGDPVRRGREGCAAPGQVGGSGSHLSLRSA